MGLRCQGLFTSLFSWKSNSLSSKVTLNELITAKNNTAHNSRGAEKRWARPTRLGGYRPAPETIRSAQIFVWTSIATETKQHPHRIVRLIPVVTKSSNKTQFFRKRILQHRTKDKQVNTRKKSARHPFVLFFKTATATATARVPSREWSRFLMLKCRLVPVIFLWSHRLQS